MQDVALIFIAVICLPLSVLLNFILMFPFPQFFKKLFTSGDLQLGTFASYAQTLLVPSIILFAGKF